MSFKHLNIDPVLVEALAKQGITSPMGIQEDAINSGLAGNDIIACAPTGTGKTLGFLLPILTKITDKKTTQCLIVTPTRELALQITNVASNLVKNKQIGVLACYGGQDIDKQLRNLTSGAQVVIGTPGRIMDLMKRQSLQLDKCQHVVLDEADQLLTMGFRDDIAKIMTPIKKDAQVMLFSATLDKKVKKLAYRYMTDPVNIEHSEETLSADQLAQWLIHTNDRHKLASLVSLLNRENPFMAIIFCRTKRRVDDLDDQLASMKFNCQKLHSDVPQKKREQIMKAFRNGEIQYLIATDVISRGIDISGVSLVVNYDVPEHESTYIHRIGRTARAGKGGVTYMFSVPRHEEMLDRIEALLGAPIPVTEIAPSFNDRQRNLHYQGEKFKHRSINTAKKNISIKK